MNSVMESVDSNGGTGGSSSSTYPKKKFGKNLNKLTKPPDAKDNRSRGSNRYHSNSGGNGSSLHVLSTRKQSAPFMSKLAAVAPRPLNTPSLRKSGEKRVWTTTPASAAPASSATSMMTTSSSSAVSKSLLPVSSSSLRKGGITNRRSWMSEQQTAAIATTSNGGDSLNMNPFGSQSINSHIRSNSMISREDPAYEDNEMMNDDSDKPPLNIIVPSTVVAYTEEPKLSDTNESAVLKASSEVLDNPNIDQNSSQEKASADPQATYMQSLARKRLEQIAQNEAKLQHEQRERANLRLKELEARSEFESRNYNGDGKDKKQLFNVNDDSNSTKNISPVPTNIVEVAITAPVVKQWNEFEHRNHPSHNKDLRQNESDNNTQIPTKRMLYDPKSGNMVAVNMGSHNSNVASSSSSIGNKRDRRRAGKSIDKVSSTKSSFAASQQSVLVASREKTANLKSSKPKRTSPRTCGVLYSYAKNGDLVLADSDIEMLNRGSMLGYGSYTVPVGAKEVSNENKSFKFPFTPFYPKNHQSSHMYPTHQSSSLNDSTYSVNTENDFLSDAQNPNIVKLCPVSDIPESPVLRSTAAPWQPTVSPIARSTANNPSLLKVDLQSNNYETSRVVNTEEDDEIVSGLGFDPTSVTHNLMMSPDAELSIPKTETEENVFADISHLNLDGSADDINLPTDDDVDVTSTDDHFAILGSPSRRQRSSVSSSFPWNFVPTSSSESGWGSAFATSGVLEFASSSNTTAHQQQQG